MSKEYFVDKRSIVRQIWGKADTILLIFAGAAAEFALNKAVDWLYFTGRLPADPLGRLFSTVAYARVIVFAENKAALRAIDAMTAIHAEVEDKRGAKIPAWAYRDVLFMLIDYSIRSFEILERKLSEVEKQEVFDVFYRVGSRMGLEGLPDNYTAWVQMRKDHLHRNLEYSTYSRDLFQQYRKHLGVVRYRILLEAQKLVVPQRVGILLGFSLSATRTAYRRESTRSLLQPLIGLYKLGRRVHADRLLKNLIVPLEYQDKVKALDRG